MDTTKAKLDLINQTGLNQPVAESENSDRVARVIRRLLRRDGSR